MTGKGRDFWNGWLPQSPPYSLDEQKQSNHGGSADTYEMLLQIFVVTRIAYFVRINRVHALSSAPPILLNPHTAGLRRAIYPDVPRRPEPV